MKTVTLTGSGSPNLTNFTSFSGTGGQVASDGTVAGQGYSYFSGSTLNWQMGSLTPIPEPGARVALGCLVGSGLCLRSRRRHGDPSMESVQFFEH